MARILVSDEIAEPALDRMRRAGHEVVTGSPATVADDVVGAHALVIRSATKVTRDVLEAGENLLVVGRAGIGLDNVDVDAATSRGVLVVNAPQSNVVSAAEHTIALLLALCRNIPQAHAALAAGRWERSRWSGVELHDKTLGIVGLGRVGRLVAQRMLAFGTRLVAYDPFVAEERARQMNVELVDLDELLAVSDLVSVHLPRTPDTVGLLDADRLARAKPGMRLVNTARGGIVDEAALAAALRDGPLAGAALDVFDEEPTTSSPLFDLPNVVVTPHLGASTTEAQDKAGMTIAEQVELALAGEFVPFAVNIGARAASEVVKPFLPLAEGLGVLYGGLSGGMPPCLDVTVSGQLADHDTSLLTLSVLKGLLDGVSEEHVTYVNAPRLAADHGLEVREVRSSAAQEYLNLLTVSCGSHGVAGTVTGASSTPRVVMVEGHAVELPLAEHLLVVRNDDTPGMIGVVGGLIGEAGINVRDMALGRSPDADSALMLLSTDEPPTPELIDALEAHPGIRSVTSVNA